ncbi:MAG: substrate-binding domain-containing protein [Candidatus Sumerlaeia bacterium]|nr:substrate-binding domain-containing protein [Candidatus Sumerlaeia bacterium]
MKSFTSLLSGLVLFFLVFGMTACEQSQQAQSGRDRSSENQRYTLIIYDSPGNPFWTKVRAGAREMGDMIGASIDVQFANNDPVRQNDILETAISNRVDGIGITLNHDDAFNENIDRAIALGIPVIAFNIDHTKGAEGSSRMAYIGQDMETAGELIARRLVEEANLKAGDLVVCPVENPQAIYARARFNGVMKVFDEHGIQGRMLNTGPVSLEETLNRLTQYLLGHPETKAIMALGGMPHEMAPQALVEASREMPIAGFDLSDRICENILAGKSIATVDQQPFYQGSLAIKMLYYYNRYSLLPCDVNTGGAIVDATNVEDVMDLAGTVR